MKTSILLIRLGGFINLLVGILHVSFWSLFDWPAELSKLSVDNSNIMQMLNLFLIVFFFYTAFVLLFMPSKLLSNTAGRIFIGMFASLYLSRLAMEFYFPNGSIGFAIFIVVAILFFVLPLVQTNKLSHAN
jgi:preprotein translocase subunit SecG